MAQDRFSGDYRPLLWHASEQPYVFLQSADATFLGG